MPKVSVLLPIYKVNPQFLTDTVKSILNQTFTDFELLILDDCPNDTRENVIQQFNDPRIKYYKNEKNLGISKSRNILIEMAQGEYLAVHDHDDISLPERFQKQVEILDKNPYIGVVSCFMEHFPHPLNVTPYEISPAEIKRKLTEESTVNHPCSMIRKSILINNDIRYEEEYTPSEDYMLWYRLMKHTEFYIIPEILLLYNWHGDNTSNVQRKKIQSATSRILNLIQNDFYGLYQVHLAEKEKNYHIYLFGIKLFKISERKHIKKFFLFSRIPLITIKEKGQKQKMKPNIY